MKISKIPSIRYINLRQSFWLLLFVLWTYESIIWYISVVLGRFPVIGAELKAIFPVVILVIMILLSSKDFIRYLKIKDFMFAFIVVTITLATIISGIKTVQYFQDIVFDFIFKSFPLYYVGRVLIHKMNDSDIDIVDVFSNISILAIISIIIAIGQSGLSFDAEWMSSQYFPYLLLPHILLVMASCFKKFSKIKFLILAIALVYMVMMGNRGSVVCFLVMFALLLLNKLDNIKKYQKYLSIVVMTIITSIVAYGNVYKSVIQSMYQYAFSHNMSTRVFLLLLGDNSEISFDSGRLELQKTLLDALKQNLLGYGIASDRYFIGVYAHNLFLELLIHFGIIFGGLLIAFIMYKLIKAFKITKKNIDLCLVLYILFCTGFIKLMISGSYLTDPYFFALMGSLISINELKHKKMYR